MASRTWKCPHCGTKTDYCKGNHCDGCKGHGRLCFDLCGHGSSPERCKQCADVRRWQGLADWMAVIIGNNMGRPVPLSYFRENTEYPDSGEINYALMVGLEAGTLHHTDDHLIGVGPQPPLRHSR